MTALTIGQAAQAADLTRKALRVYEAKGLLPAAERTTAGYRLYDERDVELLTFIRRARTPGPSPRRHSPSAGGPRRRHPTMRHRLRNARRPYRRPRHHRGRALGTSRNAHRNPATRRHLHRRTTRHRLRDHRGTARHIGAMTRGGDRDYRCRQTFTAETSSTGALIFIGPSYNFYWSFLRNVIRHSRRGRAPSSNSVMSRSSKPAVRRSTRARSKK
jgi:MerR-like DNA binding protein